MATRSLRKSRFAGFQSRLRTQAKNNLGIIMTSTMNANQRFRDDSLEILDQYYENRQYDHLQDWEEAAKQEDYVPVRDRRPRVIYNVAKVLVDKVASKITGSATFPTFTIEDDEDDTAFFKVVAKACNFRKSLVQPIKHTFLSGACLVRYYLVNGTPKIEHFNSKFCYPKYDAVGELDSVDVKYVYEDQDDKDAQGKFKQKWYKLSLTKNSDILYDNPEYRDGVFNPVFTVVEQNDHNLGWVQGEWLRTSEHKFSPDGYSLIGDILDFIDDLNYSLSQSSQAVSYSQEPQLGVNNIDEDELETLIKSSQKAWNLGREGKAAFIESDLNGLVRAEENRDHNRQLMLDVVRVVLHDPEKMAANAQSGIALEMLNAPLVELVDELRTILEPSFKRLLIKIGMTMLAMGTQGFDTVITVPAGYTPTSVDLTVSWPPMFPATIADTAAKVTAAVAAVTGHIISHKTATRFIGKDFGVENMDEELAQISLEAETMPWLSPPAFGGF